MGKTPVNSRRVILCLEVQVGRHGGPGIVEVVASIPGREGTSTRQWALDGHWLDYRTADDLVAWLSKSLLDAVTLQGSGVQQGLL